MAGEFDEVSLYRPKFQHGAEPRSLLSLAQWDNGLAFKNIDFSDGGLPVVKIAEIKSGIGPETRFTNGAYNESALLADGDLLFCWSGSPDTSIGTFRWSGGPAWLNQHVFKITPKEDVSRDYFRYLMLYLQPNFIQIAKNKQTTGLGHVTKSDLRDLLVQVPSPERQTEISAVLSPLDEKFDSNWRSAKLMEQIARAIFESWFVDFNPVLAKVERRNPSLPVETAALFPERFGEHGVPEGWDFGPVSSIVDINPSTPLRSGSLAPYVDMAALSTSGPSIGGYILRDASSGSRFRQGDTRGGAGF